MTTGKLKCIWSDCSDQIHFDNRKRSGADKQVVRQNYHVLIILWKAKRASLQLVLHLFLITIQKSLLAFDDRWIRVSTLRPIALKLLRIQRGNIRIVHDDHILIIALFGIGREIQGAGDYISVIHND